LQDRHVEISGSNLRFEFRGKSGKAHKVSLSDRRLARIVQRCQALPGEDLFQYIDDEEVRQTIGSGDVNEYIREITGEDFTAKDFRIWAGTLLAVDALTDLGPWTSQRQAKFDTYLAGTMLETLQNGTEAAVVRLLRRQLETQALQ
jgi:DNA topoisomerase-1